MSNETVSNSESAQTESVGLVVGFDGSPNSQLALDWAAATAAAYGTPITLLSANPDAEGEVVDLPIGSTQAIDILGVERAEELKDAAGRIIDQYPDLDVRSISQPHSPVQGLLDISRDADMVVLGSRGLEGFRGLIIGSTTMNVTPNAHCPVVVVYQPDELTAAAKESARHPNEVVVGYDGSASADAALEFALRHGAATGVGVAVVMVTKGRKGGGPAEPITNDTEGLSDQIKEQLGQATTIAARHSDVAVTMLHGTGRPGGVLIEEASGSLLGVVGARGRGGFKGLAMGSVSLQMLMHAECPIAVVHELHADI